MKDKSQILWYIIIGFFVLAILIGFIYLNKKNYSAVIREGFYEGFMSLEKMSELSTCPLSEDKDAFAQCLTEKGWTMYGAEWCSHCKDQKNSFGDSFKYIKYIECPDNIQLCLDSGINAYPTWKIEK